MKKIKRHAKVVLINGIAVVFFLPLVLLRKVFKVKLWRMRGNRIGHLAGNTESLLRLIQLGKESKFNHVILSSFDVANQQLLTMFKRKLKIVEIPQPKLVRELLRNLAHYSLLNKTHLFAELPPVGHQREFDTTVPSLSFTNEEEKLGKELLDKMKVDGWFICFHSRDSSYLNSQWKQGDSYNHYRNTEVANFLQAADYISQKEGYALRIGSKIDKALSTDNEKIIDYANRFRNDFGDVYLLAKCKFFLGTTAGLVSVAFVFGKPIALTNLIPINTAFLAKRDLFIPKKIWSSNEKRFLSFKEILSSEIVGYTTSQAYEKAGLVAVENTPEEILELTEEMNRRLDGNWKTTAEDEKLQREFREILRQHQHCYQFQARIGTVFLQKNKELLL